MGSTFGGLSIASTSLAAQRRAIETAGHNIANVNTPGYSRQRVDLVALTSGGAGIHSGAFVQSSGVDIAAQTRIADVFVTERLNRETSAQGSADVLRDALGVIESAFNEPGDNGLAGQLEGLWDAWDTLVTRPEDLAVRTALLQKAEAVADSFNSLSERIATVASDAIQRADAVVTDVNRITAGIADLNRVIVAQTAVGEAANDLLDQRDQLVQQLSSYMSVRTRTDDDGMMTVSASGSTLVSGPRAGSVHLHTPEGAPAVLRLDGSDTELHPAAGTLPALLGLANTVVPDQLAALDAVAVVLAGVVNDQHALGQDLQGVPGTDFFSFDAAFPGTARGLQVNPVVLADPSRVAAATQGAGLLDGSNAADMAGLVGSAGGPDALYRSMVARLGVQTNGANNRANLQDQVVQRLNDERDAISGVSLDEEMTNLIAFQQAYQASARYLTAVDEMLTTLINRTGMVGR